MIKKLFYLSNLAFLTLYIVIAWHNRLTLDDFHFMTNVNHNGIIKGTIAEYNFYSTRWLSVLVVHCILSLMPYINGLFFIGIITIIALILSFSYLLRNIFHQFLSFHPGRLLLVNLGVFSANTLFYSSMDIGNIWFWLSALPTYLWSFIFFLLGCGIMISNRQFAAPKLFLLAFSFFYIGGSAEAFAVVILLALFIATFWLYFFKRSLTDMKIYMVRLSVAFLFCFVSLIILYLGHGNIVRRGLTGEISFFKAFILNIETTGWIGLYWVSSIIPKIFLYSLPLLFAGKALSMKNKVSTVSLQEVNRTLFKAILVYAILIFIFNYPITYLLCGLAPERALLPVSFLTWVLFAFSFFYIGYKTSIKEKLTEKLSMIALAGCLLLNTYNGIHQFMILGEYDRQYDALMEKLVSKKYNNLVITVSPLPSSGMLTSMDISHDSLSYNNMFIKSALGLKADIMLVK